MMKVRQLIMNDMNTADAIVKGDRSFDLVPHVDGIKVGDFIHYECKFGTLCEKHPLDSYIYMVTYVYPGYGGYDVVNIKPVASWILYVRDLLKDAYDSGSMCSIHFYGLENHERSTIKSLDDVNISIYSEHGNVIHREISHIVGIVKLSGKVLI